MRIDYQPLRKWTAFFFPAFVMCALPDYLGITNPKEAWVTFRFWFDLIVTIAFFGGVLFIVYAMVHNARLEKT